MKPSKLYPADYFTLSRNNQKILNDYNNRPIGIIQKSVILPLEIRHYLSLFPNNHLDLRGIREAQDLEKLNDTFLQLINTDGCLERDVLKFINDTPAYHIVGSILVDRFPFGHHELSLFKEMWLGDEYRTDYVLIGKNSDGYHFVLIEFEKPEGRITLKDGHLGESFRKGMYQVEDWKSWMDGNFSTFINDLKTVINPNLPFPEEFKVYDSSRFHYVVVAGRRKDCNEVTYRTKRRTLNDSGIYLLHHDNLYEDSKKLENNQSF